MDSLNAEIALGTVANVRDAVQWLGYTYLFVRMRMNPFVYGIIFLLKLRGAVWWNSRIGIARETVIEDPQLVGKRNELINIAAQKLAANKMISYSPQDGQFQITDLGRIAAKYYIRHTSIEIFNKEFKSKMSEADVLAMLSMSTEVSPLFFSQTKANDISLTSSIRYRYERLRSRNSTKLWKVLRAKSRYSAGFRPEVPFWLLSIGWYRHKRGKS